MKEKVSFVPLGGCGEFGVNLNLYGYQDQWLMVDFGMGFADEQLPGIEIILPDIKFAEEHKKNLLGIVVTHAHEDHIGAIPYLWTRLKTPIYATPFTAEVIRIKMKEAGLLDQLVLHEIPLNGSRKFADRNSSTTVTSTPVTTSSSPTTCWGTSSTPISWSI